MYKIDNYQIGHTSEGGTYLKCVLNVSDNPSVEVAFSHRHQFYAVYWIHEGTGVHIIDFQDYELRKDRIFFLRAEQVHLMRPDSRLLYSAVQFTEAYLRLFEGNSNAELPQFIDLNNDNERKRFALLLNEIERESRLTDNAAILQGEIYLLMHELLRSGSGSQQNAQPLPDVLVNYRRLIDQHFAQKHQVAEYADLLSVSANYLNVLCGKHLGLSALALINKRIVLETKRRLMDSQMSVSEIAYSLGFNEMSYFSRFFKRMAGCTPGEFREQMNKMYHC